MGHEPPPGARPTPLLSLVMSCSSEQIKAQQWWNLSLGPECPAVVAPRLSDYVFQCVFTSPAVSGLSKWMSLLPS